MRCGLLCKTNPIKPNLSKFFTGILNSCPPKADLALSVDMKITYEKNVASTLMSLDVLWSTLDILWTYVGVLWSAFGCLWMTLDDIWRQLSARISRQEELTGRKWGYYFKSFACERTWQDCIARERPGVIAVISFSSTSVNLFCAER